jgi:signal transduction histidine kinase
LKEKRFEQAGPLYQKALRISQLRYRKQHDAWSEIYILLRLGRLETERQHFTQAKAYLDDAFEKASALNMADHLEVNYKLKAKLAEAQHQFADALFYTRKFYEYRDRVDSLSPGFDIKRYYLELETEQLELEKKQQALALQLKTSHFNNSVIIATLILLLAAGLILGLYKQRKGKQQIAAQYALIQQQTEQLKNLDAAKSRFFANISHELRTPLTLMLGPIKSLLKGKQSPQQQEQLLNIALQSGQQLQYLVNEILDLRKLEMGKMELHLQPTGLRSFFHRYTSQFESLAASSNIGFSFETSIENDITTLLDREKCRQLLHNLLSNAFKFTPAGRSVTAKICLDDNILTLEVADTGPDIHPDDLPHVFGLFYQTSRPDATAQGGTGIGLALCNEYVQLFGGKIEVESRLGEGSTFRAAFPVILTESTAKVEAESLETVPVLSSLAKPENSVSAKPACDAHPTPPTGRASILVVEDNPELQNYIRFVLAEKYNVITAGNGQEALDLLRDEERYS